MQLSNLKNKKMKRKITIFAFLLLSGVLLSFKGITEIKKASLMNYKECIEACNDCASLCSNCASECLKVKDVKLNRCIQLCIEAASICQSTSELMSLNSDNAKEICKTCADVCKKCKEECMKYDYDHCKKCAEACKKAEEMCNRISKM